MFGASGSGDTSGYGGLVAPVVFPARRAPVRRLVRRGGRRPRDPDRRRRSSTAARSRSTSSRENLLEVAAELRDDPALRFELCSGVSGVHYPDDPGRELHAVYHLTSMTYNRRIRVEVSIPDADPHIPSLVAVYPTNDWHERETFDMFGIIFDGHPALTRILMPDDWPGHPQRKDYPLGGIPVEYKGGSIPPPDQRRSYS